MEARLWGFARRRHLERIDLGFSLHSVMVVAIYLYPCCMHVSVGI